MDLLHGHPHTSDRTFAGTRKVEAVSSNQQQQHALGPDMPKILTFCAALGRVLAGMGTTNSFVPYLSWMSVYIQGCP